MRLPPIKYTASCREDQRLSTEGTGGGGSFLHKHARPLNKRWAWRLTSGSAFIKMARLKATIAIVFLVGLGECARDLTKCAVCKKL